MPERFYVSQVGKLPLNFLGEHCLDGPLCSEYSYQWHQIRIVMAEMIHFIRQMEAYCQLEVIECSWKILLDFVQKKEGDLDALIEAHRAYLDRMVKKVLLLSPKAGREENLLNQVRELFATILQFREATVGYFVECRCAMIA